MSDARRRQPWGPGFDTWQMLLGLGYRGFATGLCVTIFALPFAVALIGLPQPLTAAPFLLVTLLPLGPAVTAAFHSFNAETQTGAGTPFVNYLRGLRATAWRGLGVWTLTLAMALFVYVDLIAVAGTAFAVLLGPLFAVLGLMLIAATPVCLSAIALPQHLGVFGAAKLGLYTALRRPLLSLLTVFILAVWAVITLAQPVLGALALGGFALTAIWTNTSLQLAAVTGADE